MTLFDEWPVGRVRKTDPRPAKIAARSKPTDKQAQRTILLKHLLREDVDAITADEAGRLIGRHRSSGSTRLGGLKHDGLVEICGEKNEPDEYGNVRPVCLYRLTADGMRDASLMFGGGS